MGVAVRIATFSIAGERRVGRIDDNGMQVHPFDLPVDVASSGLLALIGRDPMPATLSPVPLSQITLEAPIPRPARNIFCVGKNYHAHAREFAASGTDSSAAQSEVPTDPIIFSKLPETVIGPDQQIRIDPAVSEAIDYEAELALIIGTPGRGISRADAMGHVWGYTIINDITARDLQGKYSQWLIGKSQDTFCPMGPWAVTADAVDLSQISVRCFVNGEARQDAPV